MVLNTIPWVCQKQVAVTFLINGTYFVFACNGKSMFRHQELNVTKTQLNSVFKCVQTPLKNVRLSSFLVGRWQSRHPCAESWNSYVRVRCGHGLLAMSATSHTFNRLLYNVPLWIYAAVFSLLTVKQNKRYWCFVAVCSYFFISLQKIFFWLLICNYKKGKIILMLSY